MSLCDEPVFWHWHREGIYLMPSPPRPNTQRGMPRSWCTISPELWSTCTASTSSTETLNQRTCWYIFTHTYHFLSTNPDAQWALTEHAFHFRCLSIQMAPSLWNLGTLVWPLWWKDLCILYVELLLMWLQKSLRSLGKLELCLSKMSLHCSCLLLVYVQSVIYCISNTGITLV